MRVAIYQYQNYSGDCPSCNQAVVSLVRIAREACKEKARELFGEDCEFTIYFDRSGTRLTGESIHNLTKRPHLQDLLIALRDLHTAHPVHHLHHQAIAVLQAAEAIPAAHPEAAAVILAADTQVAEALTQVVAVPIPAADPMAAPEGSSVTLNSTRT